MPRFFIARVFIVSMSLLVLYFGIAGLRSGKIRSRGYTFDRDEQPLGYWFTVLTTTVGSAAIIYLMFTR